MCAAWRETPNSVPIARPTSRHSSLIGTPLHAGLSYVTPEVQQCATYCALCVENILADTKLYDLWQVNGDAEYHEAGEAAVEENPGTALRQVPTRVTATPELASEQT